MNSNTFHDANINAFDKNRRMFQEGTKMGLRLTRPVPGIPRGARVTIVDRQFNRENVLVVFEEKQHTVPWSHLTVDDSSVHTRSFEASRLAYLHAKLDHIEAYLAYRFA
jgi:hypothetical protein